MIWSGERNLRFDGGHYRLLGTQGAPIPTHPNHTSYVSARAEALPFGSGTFGAAWLSTVVAQLERLSACATELCRVFIDGAPLLIRNGDLISGPFRAGMVLVALLAQVSGRRSRCCSVGETSAMYSNGCW
jgi:hypothetical protein